MRLSISVAAQNPAFSKKVRLVRPFFDSLLEQFNAVQMVDPIHEAILLGLTDSKPRGFFEEVPNRDGFFQAIVGLTLVPDDSEFKLQLFEAIRKAVQVCPFSAPDRDQFLSLLDRWWASNLT
jgi:hypothetical protein